MEPVIRLIHHFMYDAFDHLIIFWFLNETIYPHPSLLKNMEMLKAYDTNLLSSEESDVMY